MVADRHEPDSTHEFRLEGVGLLLGGGFLLAVIVGAFFLGRWIERSARPPDALSSDASGPLAQVATREPDVDAAQGLTYFDSVEGGEQESEPAREIADRAAAGRRPERRAAAAAPQLAAPDGGDFYVQVGALRDQGAAAELVVALEGQGYGVRLVSEREGQGLLYKVRVGGYSSEQQARDTAARLRGAGYAGAWVTSASD